MYILEVLPLSVLPPQVPQILNYYHDSALPKGAVVEVPLNHRTVMATVIDSYPLDSQRILVKKSLFQLKKVNKVLSEKPAIAEWQFKIALWLAQRYVAPLGLCMKAVLPPFFLKSRYPIEQAEVFSTKSTNLIPSWIITRAKDSAQQIKSLLKKDKLGQTLIIIPDRSYIPYFESELAEKKPLIMTSAMGIKDYYKIWKNISLQNNQLIIGTRQTLFLPFGNLKRIIIIDPLHEFYKSDMSPKYWTPELAEMIANNHGASLTLLSPLLGVDAYQKSLQHKIEVHDFMKAWPAKISVVDLAYEFKQGYIVGALTPDARDIIRATLKNKPARGGSGKVLIVSARRGYNGIILCQHCGYSFKCPSCDLPMRVHQGVTLSLLCHHCNHTQPYPYSCPNCHSSQIKATGPAGSQKIFEELQKMITFGQLTPTEASGLNKIPILLMDSDVTQNQTEEDEIINEVKKDGPQILIATQKIFSYGYELKFDTIIIPQLDALIVGSDFQTTEHLWYHLEKLADFEPSQIVAQTFNQKELLPELARHDYTRLYDLELSARKAFWYPPFCRIAKLTYTHADHRKVITAARGAVEKLKLAVIHIKAQDKIKITDTSSLFLKKEKGRFTYTIILKIPNNFPPRDLLRYVPTQWLIDIDPRTTT